MIDHPAIAAVRQAKRRLYQMCSPSSLDFSTAAPTFRPGQVEKMLRVEISRDEMRSLIKSLDYQAHEAFAHLTGQREGPLTIEGVAYYEVAALPDPGWRVINPMEK